VVDDQNIRVMLKSYYSVGAVLFSAALTSVIGVVWQVARSQMPSVFDNGIAGLVISAFVTFGVAYVIPEPEGMANAGKRRLTAEELFTAIIATILNFAIVLGAFCAFVSPTGDRSSSAQIDAHPVIRAQEAGSH
jgi:hypothetical protein